MARFHLLVDAEIEISRNPTQFFLDLKEFLELEGEGTFKVFSVEDVDYPEVDLEKI